MSKFRLYHYTTIENLNKILDCRHIKAIEKINGIQISPIVFLSCEKKYDCSLSIEGVKRGEARIEIDSSVQGIIKWNKIKTQSRLPQNVMDYIDKAGILRKGNPNDWYIINRDVYSGIWVNVEIYQNGRWIQYSQPKGNKFERQNAYEIAKAEHSAYKQAFLYDKISRTARHKMWI